jgi:hypothetical protein
MPSAAPTPTAPAPLTVRLTNVAEISGADQPDVDSVPGDGLAGEDDQAAVTLTVTEPTAEPSVAPSPDGVLAGSAGRPHLDTNTVITLLGAALGAALLMIGVMVLVSARRRRYE